MEFSRELREAVLSGEITVSFRLWRRAQVKPDGRYRVGDGQIQVDSVDLLPYSAIDETAEQLRSPRPCRSDRSSARLPALAEHTRRRPGHARASATRAGPIAL